MRYFLSVNFRKIKKCFWISKDDVILEARYEDLILTIWGVQTEFEQFCPFSTRFYIFSAEFWDMGQKLINEILNWAVHDSYREDDKNE